MSSGPTLPPAVPARCSFYAHDGVPSGFASASVGVVEATVFALPAGSGETGVKPPTYATLQKVKHVASHAVLPLVAAADEADVVSVWDTERRAVVLRFCPREWQDRQFKHATDVESAVGLVPLDPAARRRSRRTSSIFSSSSVSAKAFRTGSVRAVQFCDDAALHWSGISLPSSGTARSRSWVGVVCEHRVFLVDWVTHAVLHVLADDLSRKGAGVSCVARVAPSSVAVGCTDGFIYLWNTAAASAGAGAGAASASGRAGGVLAELDAGQGKPIVALFAVSAAARFTTPAAASAGSPPVGAGAGPRHPTTAAADGGLVLAVSSTGNVSVWQSDRVVSRSATPCASVALGHDVQFCEPCPTMQELCVGTAGKFVFRVDYSTPSRLKTTVCKVVTSNGDSPCCARLVGHLPRFAAGSLALCRKSAVVELVSPKWVPFTAAQKPDVPAPDPTAASPLFDLHTARADLPAKLKAYTLASHPLQAGVLAVGTNIGVFVLEVAPQFTAASTTVPAWTDTYSAVHLSSDGVLRQHSLTIAPPELSDTGAPTPSRLVMAAVPVSSSTLVHKIAPPMAPSGMLGAGIGAGAGAGAGARGRSPSKSAKPTVPTPEGAVVACSHDQRFLSVVWPRMKTYVVYHVAPDATVPPKLIDSGNGVDVAWRWMPTLDDDGDDCAAVFAVMEPPVVMKPPPAVKGAPERPTPPPVPASVVVKRIGGDGAVSRLFTNIQLTRPPAALFSGPMLAVALSSDAGAIGGGGAAGSAGVGSSQHTQFFDWVPVRSKRDPPAGSGRAGCDGTLKPVGPQLPSPSFVVWDTAAVDRVAFCGPVFVHVYACGSSQGGSGGGAGAGAGAGATTSRRVPSTTLRSLCSVAVNGATDAVWSSGTLFVVTCTQILLVFPPASPLAPAPGVDVSGQAATFAVPLTTPRLLPSPAPCAVWPSPAVFNASGVALLGVWQAQLCVGVPGSSSAGAMSVVALPLTHPAIRMAMCLAAGQPRRAVQWAALLAGETHTAVATMLAKRGHGWEGLALPNVAPSAGVPIAVTVHHRPFLHRFVSANPTAALGVLDALDSAAYGGLPALRTVAVELTSDGSDASHHAAVVGLYDACMAAARWDDAACLAALLPASVSSSRDGHALRAALKASGLWGAAVVSDNALASASRASRRRGVDPGRRMLEEWPAQMAKQGLGTDVVRVAPLL